MLPEAQRPQTITGKNNVPIGEKGHVYTSLDVRTEAQWPDDSDSSVKTWIKTNSTVLTPVCEDMVCRQCMITIKKGALVQLPTRAYIGAQQYTDQRPTQIQKLPKGWLPVQSGIDRFSGLGAKLRNKNKKSWPPLFVPTLHNASNIPSKRSPAGKEDSVRSSVDWAQFKAKRRGEGRGVFFLGTWTEFKSTAQTISQPHWSLTQPLHWPVSPFSTGDDGSMGVLCPPAG